MDKKCEKLSLKACFEMFWVDLSTSCGFNSRARKGRDGGQENEKHKDSCFNSRTRKGRDKKQLLLLTL